jgi:hypothetical protein
MSEILLDARELLEELTWSRERLEEIWCGGDPESLDAFLGAWGHDVAFFLPGYTQHGWATSILFHRESSVRAIQLTIRLVGKLRPTCEACAILNWQLGLRPRREWRTWRTDDRPWGGTT